MNTSIKNDFSFDEYYKEYKKLGGKKNIIGKANTKS